MSLIHESARSESRPKPIRQVLPNGIVVLVTENRSADIVTTRLLVKGGGRHELPHQAGIANLVAMVMTKGTDLLSSQEIAAQIESVGASLGTDATADYCLLGFKTVSEDFRSILSLAADIVQRPSFPQEEIELERRLTLQSIRSMQEQPFSVAYNHLRQMLHANTSYAVSGLGTEETVSQLDREAILDYYYANFRPENIVISIAGRISPKDALDAVIQSFGSWHGEGTTNTEWPTPSLLPPTTGHHANPQNTQQAIVMLGYQAAAVHHDDYVSLKLLSTYLGNGLSSRLFVELREKQGLAYDVSAIYPTRMDPSHFVVYMGTAPQNVPVAIEGLDHEVQRLCHLKLTSDELQISKNKLLGQYALGKQTNGQVAQLYGWYEILNLGVDFDHSFQKDVDSLTIEQLQAVAQRYFSSDRCISLVGPEESIAMVNA
ncbi:MAG: pitrilysin family protein [Cyanobacteria bacterium P01_F01_bin.150]